jgi:type I restriction enzyme S subunit
LKEKRLVRPEIPEQRKIAAVLSLVQWAIEQQERLIALTTELKKAFMHKLFIEGLRGELQKMTEIGPVPESWEVVPLGNLATKVSKGSSPRWQGFEYVTNGILFVKSQNVGTGQMDFSERVYLPREFNDKEKRSILRNEDILINLVGASIGRVALGTPEIEGANCNQAVCFVRMDNARSLKEFIVFYLLSPAGQQQIFFQKKDIARANLSLLDIRSLKIPIPQPNESKEIATIFTQIEQKIELCKRKKSTLVDIFRTLLHQLMTAQIRVHDLDLEEEGSADILVRQARVDRKVHAPS